VQERGEDGEDRSSPAFADDLVRADRLEHEHGAGAGGKAQQKRGEHKAFEPVLRRRPGLRDGVHGGGSLFNKAASLGERAPARRDALHGRADGLNLSPPFCGERSEAARSVASG